MSVVRNRSGTPRRASSRKTAPLRQSLFEFQAFRRRRVANHVFAAVSRGPLEAAGLEVLNLPNPIYLRKEKFRCCAGGRMIRQIRGLSRTWRRLDTASSHVGHSLPNSISTENLPSLLCETGDSTASFLDGQQREGRAEHPGCWVETQLHRMSAIHCQIQFQMKTFHLCCPKPGTPSRVSR